MSTPTREPVSARRDASMTLLTGLMDHALDEGYAEAAARREAGESRRSGSALLLVGLVAVGLLLAVAAAEARQRAPVAAQDRAALVKEIDARTTDANRLQAQLDQLRSEVTAARTNSLRLTTEGSQLARRLTQLEASAGSAAVTGPALDVHLEDAGPPSGTGDDPRADPGPDQGRVTDRDLQTLVNEVWASGAEAVAVNGARLTPLSAIRSAGDAILVDFRPLSPPYDIVAVGDSQQMRTTFLEGFGGSYLQALHDYDITSDVTTQDKVTLPASAGVAVRYAEVPRRAAASPSTGESP